MIIMITIIILLRRIIIRTTAASTTTTAKEINTGHDYDLFAATPPIEALTILFKITSHRRAKSNNIKIIFDAKRVYFNAKATRTVFIQLPPEDPRYGEKGICGKLHLSMYGTRDAAQNWERECASKLLSWGLTKGTASSCIYYHKQGDKQLYIHGGDFVGAGENNNVSWLQKTIRQCLRHEIQNNG